MGDINIGKMFHNFILHESIQAYSGVDLTTTFPSEVDEGKVLWERWTRCGMGFKSSPYIALQGVLWAEEYLLGNLQDSTNPFRFEEVRLNLPGSELYLPHLPWVMKVRDTGDIASKLLTYVDDLRTIAGSEEDCWKAYHQCRETAR